MQVAVIRRLFASLRRPTGRTVGVAILALALAAASPADQDMTVPADVQYALLSKILMFDRSIKERPGTEIVIIVAYQSAYPASRAAAQDFLAAARAAGPLMAQNKQLRMVQVDIGRGEELDAMLAKQRAAILYVMPVRAVDLAEIVRAADKAKMLTVSAIPDYMRYAMCVGFDQRGDRPRILINLTAARSAGADFESSLLQRVEVLGQ